MAKKEKRNAELVAFKECFACCEKARWKELGIIVKKFGYNTEKELLDVCMQYAEKVLYLTKDEFLYYYEEHKNDNLGKPEIMKEPNEVFSKETYLSWRNKKERKYMIQYFADFLDQKGWTYENTLNLASKYSLQIDTILFLFQIYFLKETVIGQKIAEVEKEREELQPISLKKPNPVLKKLGIQEDVFVSWRNERERKIVTKTCYNIYHKSLYSDASLQKLVDVFGAKEKEIIRMAKIYAMKYLKIQKHKFYEEKRLRQSFSIPCENFILTAHGIPGIQANWKTLEQRKLVLEYCYNLYEQNIDNIDLYLQNQGLDWLNMCFSDRRTPLYFVYSECYEKEYLKTEGIPKTYQILSKLDQESDPKKIIEIMDKSTLCAADLKYRIPAYLKLFLKVPLEEQKERERIILAKINDYTAYSIKRGRARAAQSARDAKKKRLSLYAAEAQQLIPMFVGENVSVAEFQEKYPNFKESVEYAKEYMPDLYKLYFDKTTARRNRQFAILNHKCQRILEGIKNGIEEDGIIRPFGLIDFYRFIPEGFSEFLKIYKSNMTRSELTIFRKFMSKYQNDSFISCKEILDLTIEMDLQKDENGELIPGSGRKLSIEEKLMILDTLKQAGIPITIKTFHEARQRYTQNTLESLKFSLKNK